MAQGRLTAGKLIDALSSLPSDTPVYVLHQTPKDLYGVAPAEAVEARIRKQVIVVDTQESNSERAVVIGRAFLKSLSIVKAL